MNPLDPFNMSANIPTSEFFAPPPIPKNYNLASEFHHRLITWINDFHRDLDDEHEVGAQLVNFGQSITFHIEDIGYWDPSLISFIGKNENGETIKLVQHVSQISILLIGLKRTNLDQPKRPIGFASWEEYDTEIKD
ncbi:DUF6173 family protein [Pseudoalteromonas sp. TB43-MNA-CIBAN-0091]|jgi:hypothetical protein|uniref:DUF6173 family protein n=1 Tax=Pseudoalteromonas sp. TB43-MNA-CIBAN-0091 TaxID=3140416 RepID=UPI003306B965